MNQRKIVAGFAFCIATASIAVGQNTAWPGPTATANVGIGTASTSAKLHVAGGSVFISGDSGGLTGLPADAAAGLALKYTTNGAQVFGYDYLGGPKSLILQGPGGNVGIGTTTASARLQVAGSAFIAGDSGSLSSDSGSGLGLKYSSAGAEVYGYNYTASSPVSLLLQRFGGKVGVGTDTPLASLSNTSTNIIDSIGWGINPFAILWRATGQGYGLAVRNDDATASGRNGLVISTAATDAGSYVLSVDSGAPGQTVNRLTVRSDGHVGIGTSSPQYALDVNGTIHATQVIGATYQDVAEWVPATSKMSPGTVVVVQRGATNTVTPSAAAYATSVAGVVSEKPGVILGESSDSKAMIATTGRVRVHVDASSGSIEAGDLLVTSNKLGMAMKSQPVDLGGIKLHRPGTLIGKALESLPNGEGDILVLLSLQ
ncbi:MAG TPA: hypothetical protein VGQ46_19080 [Thermoanaerobaculia bacterium]|nr:hypothetical protein [Thermoanaerobaculia bacterium]